MARPFIARGWPLGEHGRSGSPAAGTRRQPNVREGPHRFLQSLGAARLPAKALAQRCWEPPSVGTVPGGRLRRPREPWIQRPSRSVQARGNGSRVHPFRPGRGAASLLGRGAGEGGVLAAAGPPPSSGARDGCPWPRAPPTRPPSWLPWKPASWVWAGASGESGPSPLPRASPPLPIGPRGTAAGRLGPCGQALARRRAGFAAAAVAPVAAPGSGGSPGAPSAVTPPPRPPGPLQRPPRRTAAAPRSRARREGKAGPRGAQPAPPDPPPPRPAAPRRLQTWGSGGSPVLAVTPGAPGDALLAPGGPRRGRGRGREKARGSWGRPSQAHPGRGR